MRPDLLEHACTEAGVCLHRVDPEQGMRRFYRLQIQPTIFGELDLIREWGRVGRDHRPRRQVTHHRDLGELLEQLREVLARRFKRGYRPGPPLAPLSTHPSQEPSLPWPHPSAAASDTSPHMPTADAVPRHRPGQGVGALGAPRPDQPPQ
jgi:predicted DNA-binding WGR domain protein